MAMHLSVIAITASAISRSYGDRAGALSSADADRFAKARSFLTLIIDSQEWENPMPVAGQVNSMHVLECIVDVLVLSFRRLFYPNYGEYAQLLGKILHQPSLARAFITFLGRLGDGPVALYTLNKRIYELARDQLRADDIENLILAPISQIAPELAFLTTANLTGNEQYLTGFFEVAMNHIHDSTRDPEVAWALTIELATFGSFPLIAQAVVRPAISLWQIIAEALGNSDAIASERLKLGACVIGRLVATALISLPETPVGVHGHSRTGLLQ
jgi:hypothetical protein